MDQNKYHKHLFRLVLTTVLAGAVALPAAAWDYQVTVNGNGVFVVITGLTGNQCCGGASLDVPTGGASCSIPCGTGQQTASLSCNSVGTHVLYVFALDQTTNGYETKQTTVTISDPPPPTCPQFALIAAGTKVLTHQYSDAFGATVAYPQGQTADSEIKISVRTIAAPAGTTVYLKVTDPADSSAYGLPHQANDNIDTSAGTLSGSKTTSVNLPQAGTVDLTLKTTQYASGDNYVVQASADPNLVNDPNFVCDSNAGCRATPVITAWKRMYVEMDEMYRNSQPITRRVLVGDSLVYVNDRGFRRGDIVRLLHAPSFTRLEPYDVDGFYTEDRTITDFSRNRDPNIPGGYVMTLDAPLTRPYFTEQMVLNTQLGDAVADLSRNPQHSAALFHFSEQYYAAAFAEAFVDVIKASSSDLGVPFYDAMTEQNMIAVGNKWFGAREGSLPPSNFGLAVAAATRTPLSATGQLSLGTTVGTFSYIWRENIDDATSGPRSRYLVAGLNAMALS